jgi:hypothetical protein
MKICSTCQQYSDSLQYCLQDGTVLSALPDQMCGSIAGPPAPTPLTEIRSHSFRRDCVVLLGAVWWSSLRS